VLIVKPSLPRSLHYFLWVLAFFCSASSARAWGCKGHQTVALIAEKHMTPEAREFVEKILKENPIDPQTKRYCGIFAHSALADGSTWPDDVRNEVKNGPWHYIDIPRGAPHQPPESFCGTEGCATKAISEQWAIVKDKNAQPRKRAEALRYLTHFVGDLHMPLHASTNNDQGGNCVPVNYFHRHAHERADGHGSFVPNLHALWDTSILERDMEGADPQEYADMLDLLFSPEEENWLKAGVHPADWAWESHDLAESFVYGELVPKIPTEAPATVHSCNDDNHVGQRLLQMHVYAGQAYQESSAPVVEQRIEQAGVRLAMMLNEAASSVK
jgi:hypothetical protein